VSDYKVETVGDLHSRGFEYLRVVYVAEVEAKEDKIDRLQTLADELQARVSELVTALQDAVDIIQADANTEENYGSLCRMGSVLAKDSSASWLLRQKADAVEEFAVEIAMDWPTGMAKAIKADAEEYAEILRKEADAAGGGV
jgi:hypothetical protein